MLRKIDIRNLKESISKTYKMAGTGGPQNRLTVNYSAVVPSNRQAHIGLEDALRLVERDEKRIDILEVEISELRANKRKLIKMLGSLEGIEEQIFLHRKIMGETQEKAAEKVCLSIRQLQRIEKMIKERLTVYD
jgi:hypothetical protein